MRKARKRWIGAMVSTPAIEIRALSLELGGAQILSGIDLLVQPGEVVSVIGPSGCGKTTLLNVIAGLIDGWHGAAHAAGKAIAAPGPDRTVVFQEDAVFPWMTVRENVGYALKLRKAPAADIDRVVAAMVDLVGLNGQENKLPRQLSGGQRKRVDLARALAATPEVLLMDEPYAALDQMTKQRLQHEFLNAVHREHMTSLFVTHDLEEAIFVADRILVMQASPGRIAEIVDVPFGQSRDSDLRTSQPFQDIRRHLDHAIHSANGTEVAA